MAESGSGSSNVISRFFAWWGGELAALIPAGIRRALVRGPHLRVIEFARNEVKFSDYRGNQIRELGSIPLADVESEPDPAAVAQARRLSRKAARTAVLLPPEQALYKALTLPAMAPADLHDALAFQIDRQTPFSPDDVYFDYRVSGRDAESRRISVDLVVAPRNVVEKAASTARQLGFDPSSVGPSKANGADPFELNLLPRTMASRQRNLRPMVAIVVIAAVVAGAWFVSQSALDRKQASALALAEQVEQARKRADQLQALRDERDALIAEGQFINRRKAEAPKPVLFVEELTRVLPDHTWLFHLQQDGSRLRLSGYTNDASSLIGLVGDLPMFSDPKFGSPVTHDPRRDKDRFNLVVELDGQRDDTGDGSAEAGQ